MLQQGGAAFREKKSADNTPTGSAENTTDDSDYGTADEEDFVWSARQSLDGDANAGRPLASRTRQDTERTIRMDNLKL